jgi:hypothetical protein
MDETLLFFKTYEIWIYLLLGVGSALYLRKFSLAWSDLRGATFGLERDSAQERLNQAASVIVLLVIMAVAEFVLVAFVAPLVPGASPLPTPTIDLLATATTTLEAPDQASDAGTVNMTEAPLPTVDLISGACVEGEIIITAPRPDDSLVGEVEIRGSANVTDFGFYKLEIARQQEPLWLTIQAGRSPVSDDLLVSSWDTSPLPPGDYILQLVVVDTQGQNLPPCRIPVRINAP